MFMRDTVSETLCSGGLWFVPLVVKETTTRELNLLQTTPKDSYPIAVMRVSWLVDISNSDLTQYRETLLCVLKCDEMMKWWDDDFTQFTCVCCFVWVSGFSALPFGGAPPLHRKCSLQFDSQKQQACLTRNTSCLWMTDDTEEKCPKEWLIRTPLALMRERERVEYVPFHACSHQLSAG